MDLTDMFKEASLVDHSWWAEGILKPGKPTFDAEEEGIRKRNNTKPQLEVEFGVAGPNVDLDEPSGMVTRNIPKENLADADAVIMFARDMMNKGSVGGDIIRELKAKFDKKTLKQASSGLRKIFALDGVIGCIAVDARGYKNCQQALKTASHSPYKGFIKYVIGCHCGTPHMLPKAEESIIGNVSETAGNGFDDFLASGAADKVAMVSHCQSTMLPILSWQGDLDPTMMDQTLVQLMNTSGLSETQYDELWSNHKNDKYGSDLGMIREAFRMARVKKGANKSSKKVDAQEFAIDRADQEIDILDPAQPSLDLIPEQVPLEIEEMQGLEDMSLEFDQFTEPEFQGADEVGLDDVFTPLGPLDVDIRPDLTI